MCRGLYHFDANFSNAGTTTTTIVIIIVVSIGGTVIIVAIIITCGCVAFRLMRYSWCVQQSFRYKALTVNLKYDYYST